MQQEETVAFQQPRKQNFFLANDQQRQQRQKSSQRDNSNLHLQQRPPSQDLQKIDGAVKQKQFIYRKPSDNQTGKYQSQKLASDDDNCFEISPSLLDEISINDIIWKRILPDKLCLEENQLSHIIEENQDYFYHQLGLCACYKCKCGRCKCDAKNQLKLKLNGAFLSNYDRDFVPRSNRNNTTKTLNQKNYDTRFMNQKAIDLKSLYQQEFFEMPLELQPNFKEKSKHHIGSMSHLTSYRSNFNDWGSNYHRYSPYPHISTSPDIKFIGSTQYQDTYVSPKRWNPEQSHYLKTTLSPLPSGGFADSTTHKSSFKPFQISSKTKPNLNQKYQTIPTFEGQFVTTEMNDYVKQNDSNCPAKKFQKIFRKQLAEKLISRQEKSQRQKILQR